MKEPWHIRHPLHIENSALVYSNSMWRWRQRGHGPWFIMDSWFISWLPLLKIQVLNSKQYPMINSKTFLSITICFHGWISSDNLIFKSATTSERRSTSTTSSITACGCDDGKVLNDTLGIDGLTSTRFTWIIDYRKIEKERKKIPVISIDWFSWFLNMSL